MSRFGVKTIFARKLTSIGYLGCCWYRRGDLRGIDLHRLPRRSIEKLKQFGFDVMLAGHGEPLKGGASEKVRATAF
jgi:hypothetical protein